MGIEASESVPIITLHYITLMLQVKKTMYKLRTARNWLVSSRQFCLSTADAAKIAQRSVM